LNKGAYSINITLRNDANQSSALTEADNPELGTCDGTKPEMGSSRLLS